MKLPPTTFDLAQNCAWFLIAMISIICISIIYDIRNEENERNIQ